MASKDDIVAMFNTFIDSEDRGLAAGKQGEWYPSNWFALKQHLKKAPALLPADRLERFFVHLLRLHILPNKAEVGQQYPVLERAYGIQTKYMIKGPPFRSASMMRRLDGLLVFGFDGRGAVAANAGVLDYLRFRDAHNKFHQYSHLPGMLGRPAGLLPFAGDMAVVERLCQVMAGLRFIQDDYWSEDQADDAHYAYMELPFWAAMFTLMLSPFDRARDTVETFRKATHLPLRDTHMEIFARVEAAAHGRQ